MLVFFEGYPVVRADFVQSMKKDFFMDTSFNGELIKVKTTGFSRGQS